MPSSDPYERIVEEARRRAEADDKVSIKDLAAELGKSVRTLRRWNNRPDAPPRVKRSRRLMYRRADVQTWFQRSKRTSGRGDDTPGGGSV
jgi:ribosome-binding protein aMBF1 (putative translation factor)